MNAYATTVKRGFIDCSKMGIDNRQLSTIMHDKNGLQFMVNGFFGCRWKQYKKELEELPQTTMEQTTFDFDNIIKTNNHEKHEKIEVTKNDLLLLKNLPKYRKLYKNCFGSVTPIYIFGIYIDAKLLWQFYNITKFKSAFIDYSYIGTLILNNDKFDGILLPVRINDDNEKEKIKEQTRNFLESIKN